MADDDQADELDYEPAAAIYGQQDPPAVPVRVVDAVRTDRMGMSVGLMGNELLVLGAKARKVIGRELKRAGMLLWAEGDDVHVGLTEGQAQQFRGVTIPSGIPIPWQFPAVDELYARTASAAVADATLHIVTFNLTR